MLKQKLQIETDIDLKQTTEDIKRISILLNVVYYSISAACIFNDSGGYRLFVASMEEILCNRTYKTPTGAKIAFLKRFGDKAWEEDIKPDWSAFYPPDKDAPLYQLITQNEKHDD